VDPPAVARLRAPLVRLVGGIRKQVVRA
jgi:hypothetical protein